MMYKSGFIACCKVDGKILREDAGVVTLPFGCEYSVLLKNLNSVRAQVKVSVDGTDATEGTWLIVPANGELELERYIRNGNFDRGNRFKFIERTAQIEANKGIGASDGLIRVEYKSEVVQQVVDQTIIRKHYHDEYYPAPYPYPVYPRPWYPYDPWHPRPYPYWGTITCNSLGSAQSGGISGSGQASGGLGGDAIGGLNQQTANMNVSCNNSTSAPPMGHSPLRSASLRDVGITVPGSESGQKFIPGQWFKTEETYQVIVLQLRGIVAGRAVKTAVTVKSKPKCSTCGTVNKPNMKFCGKCGTSLWGDWHCGPRSHPK